MWAANSGCLDFHPWPSRRDDVEHPDELRIDLDPMPGTGWEEVRETALEVQALFDELGYRAYPKTSGSKGIHVYLRIRPEWTFTQVRHAALAVGREVERRRPELATSKWWKEERGERVFLDYNRMARDQTIASAYSVRARPQATVSAPITWGEVPYAEVADFDIWTMRERFAELGDVHAEHRRRRPRPAAAAGPVRVAGRGGGAVPAAVPEDGGRAAARAALAQGQAEAGARPRVGGRRGRPSSDGAGMARSDTF